MKYLFLILGVPLGAATIATGSLYFGWPITIVAAATVIAVALYGVAGLFMVGLRDA